MPLPVRPQDDIRPKQAPTTTTGAAVGAGSGPTDMAAIVAQVRVAARNGTARWATQHAARRGR